MHGRSASHAKPDDANRQLDQTTQRLGHKHKTDTSTKHFELKCGLGSCYSLRVMAPAVAAGLCSRRCPPFESCKNYRKRSSSRRERRRAHASELNNKPNAGMPPSLRATSPGCHKSRYAGEDSAASRRLQSPSARAARRTSHTLSLPTTTVRRDEDVPQDVAGEENVPRARSGLERSGLEG